MRCPKCGSENTTVLQQEHRKGYGFCSGIFGFICVGLPGLLCGLLGMGSTKSFDTHIVCGDCHGRTRI